MGYQAETEDEKAFVSNMQKLFASFVTNGNLPEENDMNLGMYVVDKEINTQRSYRHCANLCCFGLETRRRSQLNIFQFFQTFYALVIIISIHYHSLYTINYVFLCISYQR